MIAWEDGRSQFDIDLYAQRVDAEGDALWALDGVALSTEAADQENPQITSDGAGGAIVVWEDKRDDATQGAAEYPIYDEGEENERGDNEERL